MCQLLDIHTHNPANPHAILNVSITGDTPEIPCQRPFSIGIHPYDITPDNATTLLSVMGEALNSTCPIALGEAGLDKLATAPMELQIKVFKEQIAWSERYTLPLIIHCVRAMGELLALRKETNPHQPWIWHGFRGKAAQAAQLVGKGLYLSYGEYYHAGSMRVTPINRMLMETDNGKASIERLIHQASTELGIDQSSLRKRLWENTTNVFFNS